MRSKPPGRKDWMKRLSKRYVGIEEEVVVEEDCVSTYYLREFLVKNKPETIDWFVKSEEIKKEPSKYRRKIPNALSREEVEVDLNNRLEKKKNQNNKNHVDQLKNFIGFHWKSIKPEYWDVFDKA